MDELSSSESPQAKQARWLRELQRRDPKVFAELARRRTDRMAAATEGLVRESTDAAGAGTTERMVLETIVRDGRPALAIVDDKIDFKGKVPDSASREVIDRLKNAAATIQPLLHLVGRIDVENFPGSATYLGTGWRVEPNIVVTNRHVASIVARADGGRYRFIPGRFGSELRLNVDYARERGSARKAMSSVLRVLWIEPDGRKADLALLEVGPVAVEDGTKPVKILFADEDAKADTDVVVVGYPARADADTVPDQAWMDEIYDGFYDVKRIAPGLMGPTSRGWATHDCTTLGGNSGSAVLDMGTGKAVALHFAGAYMIENYAVPASQIRQYLDRQPWREGVSINTHDTDETDDDSTAGDATVSSKPSGPTSTQAVVQMSGGGAGRTISVTIPITVTVAIGDPVTAASSSGANAAAVPSSAATVVTGAAIAVEAVDVAARELQASLKDPSIVAVRSGFTIENGTLSDKEAIVVSALPEKIQSVRALVPSTLKGFPVEVRPASVFDLLEGAIEEAAATISYNDEDRRGASFSFAWVDEEMDVIAHVGPERSWKVLREFFAKTSRELISSMYEFHADHVAEAVQKQLDEGARMTLVLAAQSRDPKKGAIPKGDFDRSDTFAAWENSFGSRFEVVHVPIGAAGLVAKSYHIKVTVRDRETIWLSSGNWKRSSQPVIAEADLNRPQVTSGAGNREWHVVLTNRKIAERYRNHILADFEASQELGGTPESAADGIFVDVPQTMLESVQLEAAASRVLEPLHVNRRVRVKPLLTPDRKGKVYTDAVLELIESATRQLVFQNQYIMMRGAGTGNMKILVDALVKKAKQLEDFRIILRSESDTFWDDVTALKKRGVKVAQCVKRLSGVHTKGIVVDGERVLVGSHNWSSLGLSLNRDASLIFDDREIAEYYLEAFEIDWKRANEITLEAAVKRARARLAEGDAPPLGFERISLASYLEG
jgi:V8-like Glu-specific endopeptidase